MIQKVKILVRDQEARGSNPRTPTNFWGLKRKFWASFVCFRYFFGQIGKRHFAGCQQKVSTNTKNPARNPHFARSERDLLRAEIWRTEGGQACRRTLGGAEGGDRLARGVKTPWQDYHHNITGCGRRSQEKKETASTGGRCLSHPVQKR